MSEDSPQVALIVDGLVYGQADLNSIELHDVTGGHHCTRCCPPCGDYRVQLAHQQRLAALHAVELQDPDRTHVILTKVHTRDCPTVRAEITRAERTVSADDWHEGYLFTKYPRYVDRNTAATSTAYRCRVCCPDLPAPYDRKSDPMRFRIRCTGTGWPEDDGRCERPRRSRFSRDLLASG